MRASTKIGDIFSAKIDNQFKKYFQLVAFDLTQLNSDVIRAFQPKYSLDDNPDIVEIVRQKIDFYAHCVTNLGLKMKLWQKVGNTREVGNTAEILFKETNDYGSKPGVEPITISKNWHVWRINDESTTKVGNLLGEHRKAEIGLVINPLGIIERLKGNKYPPLYPDFE